MALWISPTLLSTGATYMFTRITARTNGVQLMIVPKSEVKDARRGAGDVRVVGVASIDEALAALREAGGVAVPPPSTAAARS